MTTTADLLARLESEGRDCPVCTKVLKPSRAPVKILTFPIGNGDRVALMPVHKTCVGEAQERIRKGMDDVAKRQEMNLWLPEGITMGLRDLD